MKPRPRFLRCPVCHVRLLRVGISVNPEHECPIEAEWWLCPECRGYHRADLATGALVPRATWAQALAAGIADVCSRGRWSTSYEEADFPVPEASGTRKAI